MTREQVSRLTAVFLAAAVTSAAGYEWTGVYGGDDDHVGVAIAIDNYGYGYVLATCEEEKVVVFKVSRDSGKVVSSWTYDTEDDDEGVDLVVNGTGSAIYVLVTVDDNYRVVKFNGDESGSDTVWGQALAGLPEEPGN